MDAVCPTASFFARLGKASVSLDPVNKNVYLCVYDTESGDLLYEKNRSALLDYSCSVQSGR